MAEKRKYQVTVDVSVDISDHAIAFGYADEATIKETIRKIVTDVSIMGTVNYTPTRAKFVKQIK